MNCAESRELDIRGDEHRHLLGACLHRPSAALRTPDGRIEKRLLEEPGIHLASELAHFPAIAAGGALLEFNGSTAGAKVWKWPVYALRGDHPRRSGSRSAYALYMITECAPPPSELLFAIIFEPLEAAASIAPAHDPVGYA